MILVYFSKDGEIYRTNRVVLPEERKNLRKDLLSNKRTYCQKIKIDDKELISKIIRMSKVKIREPYIKNENYKKEMSLHIIWKENEQMCTCMMYIYYLKDKVFSDKKEKGIIDIITKCVCTSYNKEENEIVDNIIRYLFQKQIQYKEKGKFRR